MTGHNTTESIGDRFKAYEACFDFALPRRLPLVIRVDGRNFHGLPLDKPFDEGFFWAMRHAMITLCEEIQGTFIGYQQSDEISIIARDDQTNTTEPWVGKRLSKIVSLAAAIATAAFNSKKSATAPCEFDARAFVVPDLNEAMNYLIWRQQDALRNSVSMAARARYAHSICQGKTAAELAEMLRVGGTPWEEQPRHFRHGAICLHVARQRPVTLALNADMIAVATSAEMITRHFWEVEAAPIFNSESGREAMITAYGS